MKVAKELGRAARWCAIVQILAVMVSGSFRRAQAQNQACSLATPAELKAAIGWSVPTLKPQAMPGTATSICMGRAAAGSVMLRVANAGNPSGDKEAKGIAAAKKMGAQVDVKTFGAVTCSTMIPPANLTQYGYNTTCTVKKGDTVAGIEVTASTQKDMVPIEKLRPLAERIAGRI